MFLIIIECVARWITLIGKRWKSVIMVLKLLLVVLMKENGRMEKKIGKLVVVISIIA